MKLGKEEIKRLFLAGAFALAVVYAFFNGLLGPVLKSQAAMRKSIAELAPRIQEAKLVLAKAQESERAAQSAKDVLAQIAQMTPHGAPVAWFPPQVAAAFKTQGADKALTRLIGETSEKEIAGYDKVSWAVELPRVEFFSFGQALADFENSQPLLEIYSLSIEANREAAETQRVLMSAQHLIKK
jgi:hypothetical protein